MCVTANNAIVNPAGIMIAKPTVKPTTAAGRQVYRPAGSQSGSTKVVQKEILYIIIIKYNINIQRTYEWEAYKHHFQIVWLKSGAYRAPV